MHGDEAVTKTETIADINFDDAIITDGTVAGNVNSITGMNTDTNPFEVYENHLKIGNGSGIINIPENQKLCSKDSFHTSFKMVYGKLNSSHTDFTFNDALGNPVAYFKWNVYNTNDLWETNLESSPKEFLDYMTSGGTSGTNEWNDDAVVNFDLVFDYNNEQITTTVTSIKGTKTAVVNMSNNNPVVAFQIGSNYKNNDRRSIIDDIFMEKTYTGYAVNFTDMPNGATVKVDGNMFTNEDIVPIGVHSYEIVADGYAIQTGSFTVFDSNITIAAKLNVVADATALTKKYVCGNITVKEETANLTDTLANTEYTYYYPSYIKSDDGLYYKTIISDSGYGDTIILGNGETIVEIECRKSEVKYYGEINIDNNQSTKITNNIIYSNGDAARLGKTGTITNKMKFDVSETAKYKIYSPMYNQSDKERTTKVYIDDVNVTDVAVAANLKGQLEYEILLEKGEHSIYFECSYSLTSYLDYFTVSKIADVYETTVGTVKNGTISVQNENTLGNQLLLSQGDIVTFTVTPDADYTMMNLKVLAEDDSVIETSQNTDTEIYSFTMPAQAVTINCECVKAPAYEVPNDAISPTTVSKEIQFSTTSNIDINGKNDYGIGYDFITTANIYLSENGTVSYWPIVNRATGTEIKLSTDVVQYTSTSTSTVMKADGLKAGEWYTLKTVTRLKSNLMSKIWDHGMDIYVLDLEGNIVATAKDVTYRNQGQGIKAVQYQITNAAIANAYCYFVPSEYNITIDSQIQNGTVTSDKQKAIKDETITLTVEPSEGYKLNSITALQSDEEKTPVELTKKSETEYTYIMPTNDVNINAEFVKEDYDIVKTAVSNGTILVKKDNVEITKAQKDDKLKLMVNPNEGYSLTSLLINDVEYISQVAKNECEYTMTAGKVIINATFTANTYNLTTDTLDTGTISVSSKTAIIGDKITVTVTPNVGYSLKEIIATNKTTSEKLIVTDGQFIMPASDVEVSAVLKKIDYEISIDDKIENGKVSASVNTANIGDEIIITVTPNAKYYVDTITYAYGGKSYTVTDGKFVMPASAVTISATFKTDYRTVSTVQNGNGTIELNKNDAVEGEKVDITVTPNEGYNIKSVTGIDENDKKVEMIKMSDGKYEFVMPDTAVVISVEYDAIEYTISTTDSKIKTDVTKAIIGQKVSITVTPEEDYEISKLLINDKVADLTKISNNKYEFEMPTTNVKISAEYLKIQYNIDILNSDYGQINTSANTASRGETVSLEVEPHMGYKIKAISAIDDSNNEVQLDNGNTFIMPKSNVKISVAFEAIQYQFVEGKDSTYDANNSSEGLTFKLNGEISLFKAVYVNGVEISKDNYTLVKGSTIITFKPEYLNTLQSGTYTLKALYTTGASDETTFVVENNKIDNVEDTTDETANSEKDTILKTGDNIVIYVIVLVLALAGGTFVLFKRIKVRKRK